MLARDPGAVPRVPTTLETIRIEQALTQSESMDALASGHEQGRIAAGGRGPRRSSRAAGRAGRAVGKSSEAGAGQGKAGFVPPGQLKKESGAAKANSARPNPGMGRGQGKLK